MNAVNPKSLIDKINALSGERLAEVEDFVDFIAGREEGRALSRAAASGSAAAFALVWSNPEDDVYDAC
ncbi:hypothetical protein BH09PSE1_BH09PSE1_05540 [soil metagenome]